MPRRWVWLQLLIGWLPVWALVTLLITTAHRDASVHAAVLIGFRIILAAALLGLVVARIADRVPWPHPFRPSFLLVHVVAAAAYSVTWFLLNSVIESLWRARLVLVVGTGIMPYLVLGVWLYIMIAGVVYATRATERAARAEGAAARAQLSALRAQLNPHFLFNALHTVVQLIPQQPDRAAHAAEQVAGLLRATLDEARDLVSLGEEWDFVQRYLEVEGLRFGDRLRVHADIPEALRAVELPSFTVQTLVENAVRHAASPRVAPTTLEVVARLDGDRCIVLVRDDGDGAAPGPLDGRHGSGLHRLRERLAALYGDAARLDVTAPPGHGVEARVSLPLDGPGA